MTSFKSATLALFLSIVSLLANATGIQYKAVPDGVSITITGVDTSRGHQWDRALYCLTNSRSNWTDSEGRTRFNPDRMIGACALPDAQGNVTYVVHKRAINANSVLCLIPLWGTKSGRLLEFSTPPEGDTRKTTLNGDVITALAYDFISWRAATELEASSCD